MTTRIFLGAVVATSFLGGLLLPIPASAAEGMKLTVANVTMVKVPPTCEVRSTKKRMTSGSVTEIVWTSDHATHMKGMTRDERVWPKKGRERVAIAFVGKHEFPLTFVGPGGETTCIAKVFVKPKKDRS